MNRTDIRIAGEEFGYNEWQVEEVRDGDRTWWTVLRLGWRVAEAYHGSAGYRRSARPLEPIPAEVLEALPREVAALFEAAMPEVGTCKGCGDLESACSCGELEGLGR